VAANGDAMSLEQAISELPGVVSATVERSGPSIIGVRVEMEEDADEQAVGAMVSGILEDEGYRSRVAPERVRIEPETPPMPPVAGSGGMEDEGALQQAESPPSTPGGLLRSVVVDEGHSGVSVTVTDSVGRTVTKAGGTTHTGRQRAIVVAVADLLGEEPPPRLTEVVEREGGVVLVVLEDRTGCTRAGTAVIRSGFDFAFALAVWNAFRR
jgi:hypothetical protein